MRVDVIRGFYRGGQPVAAGESGLELPDALARELITAGKVVPAKPGKRKPRATRARDEQAPV